MYVHPSSDRKVPARTPQLWKTKNIAIHIVTLKKAATYICVLMFRASLSRRRAFFARSPAPSRKVSVGWASQYCCARSTGCSFVIGSLRVNQSRHEFLDAMDLRRDVRGRESGDLADRPGVKLFEVQQHELLVGRL